MTSISATTGYAAVLHPQSFETLRFWEGCERHQFLVQKCQACTKRSYPARLFCPRCGSAKLDWVEAGRAGTVYSFTHVYVPFGETWKSQVPYTSVLVDLDEGVRIVSRLIGYGRENVKIGDPVRIVFELVGDRQLPFVEMATAAGN